jgi:DNA invertase Pin-like site-specific DNA recombinase
MLACLHKAKTSCRQREVLRSSGCTRLFEKRQFGPVRARPELMRMLDHFRSGDEFVVTALDRLARSMRDLFEIAERLKTTGARLRLPAESRADTTSPMGRMVPTIFAGIVDFERSLILERTSVGSKATVLRRETLQARRAYAGSTDACEQANGGRPFRSRGRARAVGVHRATVYRSLGIGAESISSLQGHSSCLSRAVLQSARR